MKINFKDTKVKIAFAVFILAFGAIGLLTYNYLSNGKSNEEQAKQEQLAKLRSYNELPNIINVSEQDQPLMHDLLNSFIGNLFTEVEPKQQGTQVYVYGGNMEHVYASVYSQKDKIGFVPNLGSKPFAVSFDKKTFENLTPEFKKRYPDRFYSENGYNYLFVDNDEEMQAYMISKGVDYKNAIEFDNLENGEFYERNLANGKGYPTDILRKEPYKSNLEKFEVHMDNDWWNSHRYGEVKFYQTEDGDVYKLTTPYENKLILQTPVQTEVTFLQTNDSTADEKLKQYLERSELKEVGERKVEELLKAQ